MSKKGQSETSWGKIVLVLLIIAVISFGIYKWVVKPSKGVLNPVAENLAKGAEDVINQQQGGITDYDKDGVDDSVDKCCDCVRIGRDGVVNDPNLDPTGTRLGCANEQTPGNKCPGPCTSALIT